MTDRRSTAARRDLLRALTVDADTIARDLERAHSTMLDAADPLTAKTWAEDPVTNGTDSHADPTASAALAHQPGALPGDMAQPPAVARRDLDLMHNLARSIVASMGDMRRIMARYVRTCPDCGDALTRFDQGMYCDADAKYRNAHGHRASARTIGARKRARRDKAARP